MFVKLLTCAVFFALLFKNSNTAHVRVKRIVGGKVAPPPTPDDPVVFSRKYNRAARVEGFRNPDTGIYSFLGIRFADPPIGTNRFTRPRYRRLQGDINATAFGPPCPQPHPRNPNYVVGNEDCLLLNIYTPQMPDETTGLPVYLWIHPGGFRYGSAAQYDAMPVAQEKVIFVPVQYRLGTLGIIGDGTKEFDGNLAMFDMTAALRWVTEYISFFGGDPKQIKVIGHGSGATSAMYLSMSKLPKSGSISGVVAMSGSALSEYAHDDEPVQSAEEIARINGCTTTNETEIVECLRSKSFEEIVKKDSEVQTERLYGRAMIKGLSGSVGFSPHVEQNDDNRGLPGLITAQPRDSMANGNFSNIPLLIGVAKQETGNAITPKIINDGWGSANDLLNSLLEPLQGLKGFLRVDNITGIVTNTVLPGVQGLTLGLNDVLKVPESLNALQILTKVIDSTTDALFNLPAVLTAQNWGKTASAFLYSFEYKGSTSKGVNFLRGLPIVSADEPDKEDDYVAHGDELGYMFDVNDIEGNPLPETRLTKPEDLKVRKNLISLLVNFAKPKNADGNLKSLFKSVSSSGEGMPFIKIDSDLEFSSDFRACELLLWGAKLSPTPATSCQGFADSLGAVTGIVNNVTNVLTNTLGLGSDTNTNPLSNVLNLGGNSGSDNRNNANNQQNRPTGGNSGNRNTANSQQQPSLLGLNLGGNNSNKNNENSQEKPSGLGGLFG
ncbi:carboxylesterase 5A-like [Episyrphus balteatus]|uniref:carboxylesterase 5A-like n=1 Tax=Episyrphus balteatus TaxID=286459 RepID=UPI0024863FC6|nr:carboxylesterase 5A-like [Episyrphus balteatus]